MLRSYTRCIQEAWELHHVECLKYLIGRDIRETERFGILGLQATKKYKWSTTENDIPLCSASGSYAHFAENAVATAEYRLMDENQRYKR